MPAKVIPEISFSLFTSKEGILFEVSSSLLNVIFSDKDPTSSSISNISLDAGFSST